MAPADLDPTLLAAAAAEPSWLHSPAAVPFLWLGTGAVAAVVLRRVLRPRSDASAGVVAVALLADSLRVVLFASATTSIVVALWLGGRLDGLPGELFGMIATVLYALAAFVGGLFIARQFTAPPWWRLNAWEPSFNREAFGITNAFAWIRDDVVELIASLRPVDRLVVLVGVPLATLNLMAILGTQRALLLVHAGLLLCYVALVVALFTANRIPRVLLTRLQDLRQVARRISGGDLTARVDYTDSGEYEELGELVTDVNAMARALQSREQENAALNQRLQGTLQMVQERASRDPLTQLRNHRYFQEALAAELYRCSRTGEVCTIAVIDLDDFKAVNDTYGHQEGDAVLVRAAAAFAQTLRPYDLPARLGGEEFGVIFPSTAPEEAKVVMDRIMEVLATAGPNGTRQTFSGGIATFPIHATDQSTLYQLADSSAYVAKLNGKRHTVVFDPGKVDNVAEDDRVNTRDRDARMKATRMLVESADLMEGASNEHSENVGRVSAQIATVLGYDDTFAQQMYLCGLLHDVGKLGLDQSLVTKAGRLSPAEFEEMKRHPELSAQIVTNAGLGELASWVRHHHEHFDGSGYPHGLAGQDIPVASRIILAAEAFDVMTTDRPYRRAMSARDAVDELLRGAGSRFDPDVVVALVELVRNGQVRPGGSPASHAEAA